ncbi:MAG: uncharacterized protein JWN20_219 [Jatrophihabitantaceae bacterium]|nr:uncharacterized protein [Jatrophihabitantaceae bacterium]
MAAHPHVDDTRLNLAKAAPEAYRALGSVDKAIRNSPLDATIRELVKLRTSQINGCTYCVDLHSHEALELGDTLDRILQLVAWRESLLFAAAERAALEYTEAVTILTPHGVSDEVWAGVRETMDDEALGALVLQVAMMNALNRLAVPLHQHPKPRS